MNRHVRSVAAYVLFVVAISVGLFLYQRHVNARFDHADQVSCHNRTALTENQRLVLSILHRNVLQFLQRDASAAGRAFWARSLERIEQAQEKAVLRPC